MEPSIDAAVLGLAITVMLNFAGLVWGAASISASVKELRQAVSKLDKTMAALDHLVGNLDKRVAVLEDRGIRGIRGSRGAD